MVFAAGGAAGHCAETLPCVADNVYRGRCAILAEWPVDSLRVERIAAESDLRDPVSAVAFWAWCQAADVNSGCDWCFSMAGRWPRDLLRGSRSAVDGR